MNDITVAEFGAGVFATAAALTLARSVYVGTKLLHGHPTSASPLLWALFGVICGLAAEFLIAFAHLLEHEQTTEEPPAYRY